MYIQEHVKEILFLIGENPEREGLADTPDRVAKAYEELFRGYSMDAREILETTFRNGTNHEMICVNEIDFWSTCEHHMLPFHGKAYFAYMPSDSVVGLSKIPRLVEMFARRLQIQERMTNQIVEAFEEHMEPLGTALVVRANHLCMKARGVKNQSSYMQTMKFTGDMLSLENRAEFLRMIPSITREV